MNTVIDLKKLLIGGSVALLLAPVFAFAAYNDVTLTTDTVVLSVNGITINVTGASAELDSIEVGSTSFTVTLAAGSSIDMTAPNLNVFSVNTAADQVTNVCTGAQSKLGYLATGALTLIVTPQTSLCASASGGSSSSSGGGGGGGGGGVTTTTTTATTTTTTATTTSTTTQPVVVPVTTTQTPAGTVSPEILALIDQLRSLVAILKSLGGTVSPELEATLNAFPAAAPVSFTRNLDVGGTGEDVRALQRFLNAKGYQIVASGPGSPGNETTTFGSLTRAALAKFQEANGIFPPAGYFGPKTRAFIAGM